MARIQDVLTTHEGHANTSQRAERVQESVRVYMTSFLSGATWDAEEAYRQHKQFLAEYNDLEKTEQWYQAIVQRHLNETTKDPGYEAAMHIAMDVGAEYSAFNDKQCTDLKRFMMS